MFVYLLTILLVRKLFVGNRKIKFGIRCRTRWVDSKPCISFIIRNQFENEIESDLLKKKKFRAQITQSCPIVLAGYVNGRGYLMTTFITSSSDVNTQIPNLRILILITKIECCYLNLLEIYTRIYKQTQVRKKNKDS